jgi:iron complex outermembrane recepter protein
MMKSTLRVLVLVLLCAITQLVQAQQKQVSGTIKDAKGMPVVGASIVEKGSINGTSSDEKGNFSLIVKSANAKLLVSSVGFTDQEITVGSGDAITVTLKSSEGTMDAVVVTALGVSKQKRALGFSVTEVKGETLAKTNEVNPINALQGKVAGVQIDQGAGGLFGSTKILIRGNSTLGGNNQPIFVIDGVIMDNDVFNGTGRDFGNDLKNLNMEDFETVSVLKGSAAAALYGTRAINGVILITTKKGVQRKGIGVSVNQTFNVMDPYAGPDFQNEFGGGTVGAFFTDNREPNYGPDDNWRTKIFPIDPITGQPYIDRQINRELENWGPRLNGQSVQNYDGTMTKYVAQPNNYLDAYQKGYGSNTNIALEGGTDRSTFRLSYNHNQGKGIYLNNNLRKDAFDLRITHKITKGISIDVSTAYTNFDGKNPPRLGGLDAFGSFNIGHMYTWVLPRNYDTKYWMRKENYTSILGGAPDPTNSNEPNKAPETRFWYSLYNNNYTQNEQMLRSRVAITTQLTSWAKLVLEGNINNIYQKSEAKELGQGINYTGGLYNVGFNTKESQFLKWMVMMNKNINKDITVSGYVGGERQNSKTTYSFSETRNGLLYPGNYFLTNSVDPLYVNGGILTRKRFNSLYASADISYKNMLYLQATWRGDWSSALTYTNGKGNNFYNYPAVSASWIFTEAFKLPNWISFGKLRASVAALGGDTGPFTLNPGFALNGFSFTNGGSVPTSTNTSSQVLQPNIKPLRKLSREIGLDMRFFNNRLGFDLSLYQDNTKNQILPISAPVESGVSSILINAGEIQNKGIEFSIDGTPVSKKNFTWTTAFNISKNKNLIVDLYPNRTELDLNANIAEISTWAVVGKSYGTLRTTIAQLPYQAVDAGGNKIDDPRNGLPVLNWRGDARAAFPKRSNFLQDVGDINADFRFGWDNTFRYKNFSLNVLLDAKIGGDFVLSSYRFGTHTGVFPNTLKGRDAEHGGITWTSKYDGQTYDDGIIVEGVFPAGLKITQPDGSQAEVGGLTFKEAYDKGFVEPTHLPQFGYRYGSSSTGVANYWIVKSSWISLRQVALSYNFNKELYAKLRLNGLSLSVVGRDLLYLYNTLPYNFNPASNNSNNTAFSGENGFLPMTRNVMFSLRASF